MLEKIFIGSLRKSKSRPNIESTIGSGNTTPTKINIKAIDKYVNRQELARWMKKEKEIYDEKLQAGSLIDHKSMKKINEQKNALLREISLPTNEDFSNYNTLNSQSNRSGKKQREINNQQQEFYEKDMGKEEIEIFGLDNAIDHVFVNEQNDMFKSEVEIEHPDSKISVLIISRPRRFTRCYPRTALWGNWPDFF